MNGNIDITGYNNNNNINRMIQYETESMYTLVVKLFSYSQCYVT